MVDVDNLSIIDFNTSPLCWVISTEHPIFLSKIEFRTKMTIPLCA